MTALLYVLGRRDLLRRHPRLDRAARARPHDPGQEFGVKVTQYFIGFGPTVWSKQVGETEYGVKAIPLGGYVKIVGMLPPGAADLADEVDVDATATRSTGCASPTPACSPS